MAGFCVLDLSVDVPGGFCTKLLAMNGARVLRPGLQSPLPDAARPAMDDPATWLELFLHQHKQRLAEPLDSSARSAALVRSCDVVVTSFDGGRYQGPWAEDGLRAAHPGVVHLTTSSFGTTGHYAAYHGGPLVDWAAGGYLFITGDPDHPPLAGPRQLCGYVAGLTAAVAVEAALERRRLSGRGCHLDISTMEAMLSMHQSTFSRLGAGILRTRTGRYTEVFPLVVLPAADGYVSLGVVTDDEFDRLALAMDHPELAVDDRFSSVRDRERHRPALEAILRRWLAGQDCAVVVDLLQSHGLPSAKVASPAELLVHPQLTHRRFFDRARLGNREVRMPGNLLRWAPTGPTGADEPAPAAPNGHPGGADSGAPPTGPEASAGLPLGPPERLLVLDLTAFWAGPSATRNLADLGARVIRVERPGSRLDFSASAPGDPVQLLFDHKTNRHKESVVLDLRQPAGRRLFLGLVERADAVVDNYRAGVMESLGLGHEVLVRHNPRLVHVALSGFGATGPWSAHKSYGPTIEAASSIEFRTRYPGSDEPLRLGHTLPDGVGGLLGTYAVLVGLRRRHATGRGCLMDLSQLEAYCSLSGEELAACSVLGPEGAEIWDAGGGGPADLVACPGADRWLATDPADDEQQVVVDRELADAGATPTPTPPTPAALAARLQAAGVPAFPAATAADLVADPHLDQRHYFVETTLEGRPVRLPGSPFVATPPLADPSGTAPEFGAHTAAVLRELLGTTEAELERLCSAGAVFSAAPVASAPGR